MAVHPFTQPSGTDALTPGAVLWGRSLDDATSAERAGGDDGYPQNRSPVARTGIDQKRMLR